MQNSRGILALGPFVRIAVALPLMALSGWVLLPFAIVPVSSTAITNARISRVRTMVGGQVLRFHVEVGDRVGIGQTLLEIVSAPPDGRIAAERLSREKSEAEIHETALNAQIAEAERRVRDYDKRAQEYAMGAPREIELDREAARLETILIGLRQRYTETHPEVRRISSQLAAVKRSRASLGRVPGPLGEPGVGGADRNLEGALLARPDADGQPVRSQREEAAAELSRLRQEKLAVELRRRALAEQLDQATSGTGRELAIKSPVDGIVWTRDIPAGQTVREGDDLIRIAETNSIQVEGYVDSRYAGRLSSRDNALIYLTSENKRLSGKLTLIQAPGQRSAGAENFAIDLKAPSEGLYRVVVQLNPADRDAAWVGQVAKVVFPGPDSSLMARAYSWFSRF